MDKCCQKSFGLKILCPKIFWRSKILGQILRLSNNWAKKFGQNWVSNSWNIPDMDKCVQDKCCLDKCHCDSWYKLKMVQGTYFQSLVKIRSITAEKFLIWINVARTNVAWTWSISMKGWPQSIRRGP